MSLVIEKYFLLFIIYSFLGWCMEEVSVSILNKKVVNRGFLLGPICPIYGFGALFITILLGRFSNNPLLLFVMIILVCGILEYLTSWLMEVIFKARWWDYSNRKFNIKGRVCLRNLFFFGVLGLAMTYLLNPVFLSFINNMSINLIPVMSIILGFIFVIDASVSFVVIFRFRTISKSVNEENKQDNTEQITKMVRELFAEKSFLHRRFIDAYPKLEAIKTKIKEIKTKIDDATSEMREAVNEKKEQFINTIDKNTKEVKMKIYLSKENFKLNMTVKLEDLKKLRDKGGM